MINGNENKSVDSTAVLMLLSECKGLQYMIKHERVYLKHLMKQIANNHYDTNNNQSKKYET